jgi:hypothetical protein
MIIMSHHTPRHAAVAHTPEWPDGIPGTATFKVEVVSPAGLTVTDLPDAAVIGDGYERTEDLFAQLANPGEMLVITRLSDVS